MTAIIVLVSAVVLANNSAFGGSVLLGNLAYDVALSIRQAQVYGIAVARFGNGPNDFNNGYGMHFDLRSSTYYLFADTKGTGTFNPNDASENPAEVVQRTDIQRGYVVADLCVTHKDETTPSCGLKTLDIVFKRPEPDAFITGGDGTTLNAQATIKLQSPRGDTRTVTVDISGQISVPQPTK